MTREERHAEIEKIVARWFQRHGIEAAPGGYLLRRDLIAELQAASDRTAGETR